MGGLDGLEVRVEGLGGSNVLLQSLWEEGESSSCIEAQEVLQQEPAALLAVVGA